MNTPPPGHNANESMLSGGTEPIVGVMGGGTRKKYNKRNNSSSKSRGNSRSKSRRKNSRRKTRASVGGGRNPFNIHSSIHDIKDTIKFKIEFGSIRDLPDDGLLRDGVAGETTRILKTYILSQKTLWKRHIANGVEGDKAVTMKADSCPSKYDAVVGENGVGGSDRLGIVLPKSTSKIILLPPCKGNTNIYTKCINHIKLFEKEPNTVFIFTPPFYSTTPGSTINNMKILDDYVAMKKRFDESAELASVHILSEYTQNTLFNACFLTGDSTELVPLLEPTYIIFPYTVGLDDTNVSGILFSAAARDEVILPKSGIKSNVGLIGALQNGVIGGHAWPTKNSENDPLFNSVKIPYRRYRFFSKKVDNDLLDMNADYKIMTISQVGAKPVPAWAAPAAAPAAGPVTSETKFEPSKLLFLTGVTFSSVPLGSNEYSLRHPRTPEVVEDWKNLVFTEDEADFLNDLNLRPKILADIYSSTPELDWKSELAKNMATIVRSKCFKDPRLVLHSDCQVSNKFIQRVLDYYVKNDARITALENDESEAEKNELRLRAQAGWAAAAVAVNPAIDKTGWDKNPFTDGLVVDLKIKHIDPDADFGVSYDNITDRYTRIVVLTKKTAESGDDKDKFIATISCDNSTGCTTRDLAEDKLEEIYERIKVEYPGYTIYP